MAFKLDKATREKLFEARNALEVFVENAREEFDEKSDSWREGDKGGAVDGWLDELQEAVDTIENLSDEPEV